MACGSDPSSVRQNSWLTIATGAAPSRASSSCSSRPSAGWRRSARSASGVTAAPWTRSASPPLRTSTGIRRTRRATRATAGRARRSMKSPSAMSGLVRPVCTSRCRSTTRSSARSNGSGRSSTASTMANSAVLAPMPSARVTTAVAAKAGSRRKIRSAWRRSRICMDALDGATEADVVRRGGPVVCGWRPALDAVPGRAADLQGDVDGAPGWCEETYRRSGGQEVRAIS